MSAIEKYKLKHFSEVETSFTLYYVPICSIVHLTIVEIINFSLYLKLTHSRKKLSDIYVNSRQIGQSEYLTTLWNWINDEKTLVALYCSVTHFNCSESIFSKRKQWISDFEIKIFCPWFNPRSQLCSDFFLSFKTLLSCKNDVNTKSFKSFCQEDVHKLCSVETAWVEKRKKLLRQDDNSNILSVHTFFIVVLRYVPMTRRQLDGRA